MNQLGLVRSLNIRYSPKQRRKSGHVNATRTRSACHYYVQAAGAEGLGSQLTEIKAGPITNSISNGPDMTHLPTIWQRLVSVHGRTCQRCDATYQHLQSAIAKLSDVRKPLNIDGPYPPAPSSRSIGSIRDDIGEVEGTFYAPIAKSRKKVTRPTRD